MGGFIPFPDIPLYPGVPQLLRPVQQAIAASPIIAIGLGTAETLLITALNQAPQWGIYDSSGNQLGLLPNSQSILSAIAGTLLSQLTGDNATVLSTFDVDFTKETKISDYPLEAGGFAAYNKAESPASPVVTLILDGDASDRTAFLNLINAACVGTDLYSVVTPEITYYNHSVERYRYSRKANKGLTLLIVEVFLKEIRTVTSTYSTVSIVNPINAAATPAESNGVTQTVAPDQSVLSQIAGSSIVKSTLSSFGFN
jgi:hypothetical protein